MPILGAILVSLLPRKAARPAAILVALANFMLSLHLVAHWGDAVKDNFHFVENREWMPQLGLSYHLGVDGVSLFLVLLSTFLTPLVLLMARKGLNGRGKQLAVLLLLVEAASIGAFSALDTILFYIFFEATLIPVYLMIVGWGDAERSYAALKFFLYTMAGSVLMWVALLFIYIFKQTGGRAQFRPRRDDRRRQLSGIGGRQSADSFCSSRLPPHSRSRRRFSRCTPGSPTPTPKSPTSGDGDSGGGACPNSASTDFCVSRFLFSRRPPTHLAPIFIALAIIGIIYGALVAIAQTDLKRLLAYSSLSHVSLIILGVFAALLAGTQGSEIARSGAVIQMLNHGLTTAALFLLAGMLIERRGSRVLADFGGLAAPMPRFTVLFWIAMFASIGLPGLNGFVGEYLILQGAMFANFRIAFLAATGRRFSARFICCECSVRQLMYRRNHASKKTANLRRRRTPRNRRDGAGSGRHRLDRRDAAPVPVIYRQR